MYIVQDMCCEKGIFTHPFKLAGTSFTAISPFLWQFYKMQKPNWQKLGPCTGLPPKCSSVGGDHLGGLQLWPPVGPQASGLFERSPKAQQARQNPLTATVYTWIQHFSPSHAGQEKKSTRAAVWNHLCLCQSKSPACLRPHPVVKSSFSTASANGSSQPQ